MPNHVTNCIRFTGEAERIRAIMEEIKNELQMIEKVLKNIERIW